MVGMAVGYDGSINWAPRVYIDISGWAVDATFRESEQFI
jgi:hypothetical protein